MALEPIPGPPGLPILGNVTDIDAENPNQSFNNLSDIYGVFIYFLDLLPPNATQPSPFQVEKP